MKVAVALTLVASTLAAPTPNLDERGFVIGGSGNGHAGAGGSAHVGASAGLNAGLSALANVFGSGNANVARGLFPMSGLSGSDSSDSSSSDSGSTDSSSGGFDMSQLGSLFGGGSSSSSAATPTASSSASASQSAAASSTDSSDGGFDISSLLSGASKTDSASDSTSSSSSSSSGFGSLLGGSMTSNDVTDNNGCKELTFIFARGTSEMGNMGSVVGPKVGQELNSLTGNKAAIQGVDYPADAAGNAQMGASGGPKMASLVKQAKEQCPDTKIVLGGYSQGAMVVHNAAGSLSSGQVVGAVTFGDPFKSQKPDNIEQFKTFCASGDPVCLNGSNVMAHLSYGDDAATAAKFLVSAAGL
ncbi:cutinase-domain-containing protein [Aspergillus unguis]